MATFKDSRGRKWNIILDEAARARAMEIGCDFSGLANGDPTIIEVLGGTEPDDIRWAASVMYMLLRPQCEARGIPSIRFVEEVMPDNASAAEALVEEMVKMLPAEFRKQLAR